MSPSTVKTVVVFGATGTTGRPFVQKLASLNSAVKKYEILAITRDQTSAFAQRLAKLPGVRVAQISKNALDEPAKAFQEAGVTKGGLYGVYSVQGYVSGEEDVKQGKAIADAAVEYGAKHLVYLSTDFGPYEAHAEKILLFNNKYQVEQYIRTLPIGYTFLRPAQFMDNLVTDTFFFKMGRTVLIRKAFVHHPDRKHQLISGRDIGHSGAVAIDRPEIYLNREIRLAGDEVTMEELLSIYREVMGEPVKETFGLMAGIARCRMPIMKQFSDFLDDYNYQIDIPALRAEYPDLEDLRSFLKRVREGKRS